MSVAFTERAVIERRKTVTRRTGWWQDRNGRRLAKPGDTVRLCRKVMGRKPGEPLVDIALVRLADLRREPLSRLLDDPAYGAAEMIHEGFPGMDPADFIDRYFVVEQGVGIHEDITRIRWVYLDMLPVIDDEYLGALA